VGQSTYKGIYRATKVPSKCSAAVMRGTQSQPQVLSSGGRYYSLAYAAVVLLRPKQSMEEQDGRCLVGLVRDRLGWFVEVVDQGHGGRCPRRAVRVMRHKRTQSP
jgi:hypothetical protein